MTEGHVAIVTGGASGIGAAIVQHLLDAGYEVVVLDRQAPQETHAKLHAVQHQLHRIADFEALVRLGKYRLQIPP